MAATRKNPAAVALGKIGGLKDGVAGAAKVPADQRSAGASIGTGTEVHLLAEVRDLILAAHQTVARGVNAALVLLYWRVGDRIHREVLGEERADYGEQIVVTLSRQLAAEFGRGFAEKNLRRMVQFAEVFPDEKIVAALSRQLGWSHFVELLPVKRHLQRGFYAEMCRIEGWSARRLRQKIDGMLYERTALSRKPAKLAAMELAELRAEDKLTPDLVFRDPYFLDFLSDGRGPGFRLRPEASAGQGGRVLSLDAAWQPIPCMR